MQNLTGSMEPQNKHPLSPFEQAEYNLLQFANNTAFGQKFNTVIERLEQLEFLKELESKITEDKQDKDFQKNIEDEIKSIELVLNLLFDVHENLPEA